MSSQQQPGKSNSYDESYNLSQAGDYLVTKKIALLSSKSGVLFII